MSFHIIKNHLTLNDFTKKTIFCTISLIIFKHFHLFLSKIISFWFRLERHISHFTRPLWLKTQTSSNKRSWKQVGYWEYNDVLIMRISLINWECNSSFTLVIIFQTLIIAIRNIILLSVDVDVYSHNIKGDSGKKYRNTTVLMQIGAGQLGTSCLSEFQRE